MNTYEIYCGDVLEKLLEIPDESVQCCVTSPPYWGLRDYGVDGQIGLEKTPEEYVEKMVQVFREVRRVLRKDGTVWLNLGDSYVSGKGRYSSIQQTISGKPRGEPTNGQRPDQRNHPTLKDKDLCGIPWMVAFALRADGWWLRSDIIWSKPNPMPESVTDRPTKAHEYIFLLTKSAKYYYDADAIREPQKESSIERAAYPQVGFEKSLKAGKTVNYVNNPNTIERTQQNAINGFGRNARTVWEITTKSFSGAHFATFPPELPERCIKAGTSEKGGCAKCGASVERVTEYHKENERPHKLYKGKVRDAVDGKNPDMHVGGGFSQAGLPHARRADKAQDRPTCKCNAGFKPCVVLDPFLGSGTTGEVALRLGRDFKGIELSKKYIDDLIEPRLAAVNPMFVETNK